MTSTSPDSVSVTSRRKVLCANEPSWKALGGSPFRLGPFDQVAGFVYAQPNSNIEIIPIERLQRGLELLLDYYPQLTGRLQIDLSNGMREIVRLNTGAELLEARCSQRLDPFSSPSPSSLTSRRILMQDLPAASNALLAPFDATPDGVCRDPLFAVQHTRFSCGSVALGMRVHHTVCDGDGFFQLACDLAQLYRSLQSSETISSLPHPPHIRPHMSDLIGGNMKPKERSAALDVQPPLFHTEPPTSAAAETPSSSVSAFPPPPYAVEGRFIRFYSTRLKALKAQATDPSGSGWVSTFDVLSAYIYQRIHQARLRLHAKDANFGELSRTDFLTPVNLRSRLGLPPCYFPNTLFASNTTIPVDQVAKVVHDVTHSSFLSQKDEIDRSLKWIAAQHDARKIEERFQYGNGSFMVSQWNKFNMYAGSRLDFVPVLVSPPFKQSSLVDGLAYFLPTEEMGWASRIMYRLRQ
ncbi:transferase [Mycena haematopus]|nr:transferase [Mycena haematopus]